MKKKIVILLCILSGHIFSKNPDCVNPTEYIMQFLSKSSTFLSGSTDWKNDLNDQNKAVKTVFARTHLMEYRGVPAAFLRLHETGVQGFFEIAKKDGYIEIDSLIEDVEVRHANDKKEIAEFRALASRYEESETKQSDACSDCQFITKTVFDEKTHTLKTTLRSKCKSKIPFLEFMRKINEN